MYGAGRPGGYPEASLIKKKKKKKKGVRECGKVRLLSGGVTVLREV